MVSNINLEGHVFTCQKCGSHHVTKILTDSEPCFYSGFFMCSDCGTSLCDGERICYYSSCFHVNSVPLQLSLDFGF